MKPIINPWFFYLISIGDLVKILFIIGALVTFAFFLFFRVCEPDVKRSRKLGIIALILIVLGVLTPARQTGYQMLIANYVTPNNLEITKDNAKDIVDYIIEAVDKISNKEE